MKSFLIAMVALVVIATGANFGLKNAGLSSAQQQTTSSVRLD